MEWTVRFRGRRQFGAIEHFYLILTEN